MSRFAHLLFEDGSALKLSTGGFLLLKPLEVVEEGPVPDWTPEVPIVGNWTPEDPLVVEEP